MAVIQVSNGIEDLSSTTEQKAWYFYDWANSAYVTTTTAVLFSPYLTSIAEKASCGFATDDNRTCQVDLNVLGINVSPGSLVFYLVPLITVLSAILLPIIGAIADRHANKPLFMAQFAWVGSIAAAAMVLVGGTNWQLGALLLLIANLCLGASLVIYDAILIDIADPDDRDRVSSRGWALGYLGGGLLLAANFLLLSFNDSFGMSTETAVRISLCVAGIWWGAFTFIPLRGIKARPPRNLLVSVDGSLMRRSFGQLWATLKDLKHFPQTLIFLLAYLFYNDGIQTVIYAASVYGEKQLKFDKSSVLLAFLTVQFVGIAGALAFGRLAARIGTRKTIMLTLSIWMLVVVIGYFLPEKQLLPFLFMAILIGLVLGGSQALSRSFYSQLIPRGREAEYFSLYQACERGTSWFGMVVFGVVHQMSGSYRPAIVALIIFFALGLVFLSRLDVRQGINDAGNIAPANL